MTSPRGIILLEGADASGKTTLANELRTKVPSACYIHFELSSNAWRRAIATLRRALRLADTRLVIVDRLWISTIVYSEVFRGESGTFVAARCLDRVLQRAGALTILTSPRDSERQIRRIADEKPFAVAAGRPIERVVQYYADLRDGNLAHPGESYLDQIIRFGDFTERRDVIVYDLDRSDLGDFATRALRRLASVRARQLPEALDSTRENLSGSVSEARFALIGDSVSTTYESHERWPRWPFVWNETPSATTWLNLSIHKLALDERRIVYTNVEETRYGDFARQLANVPSLRLIALGKSAADYLRRIGHPPDRELPDPQWHRRFRYEEGIEGYAESIRGAMR